MLLVVMGNRESERINILGTYYVWDSDDFTLEKCSGAKLISAYKSGEIKLQNVEQVGIKLYRGMSYKFLQVLFMDRPTLHIGDVFLMPNWDKNYIFIQRNGKVYICFVPSLQYYAFMPVLQPDSTFFLTDPELYNRNEMFYICNMGITQLKRALVLNNKELFDKCKDIKSLPKVISI